MFYTIDTQTHTHTNAHYRFREWWTDHCSPVSTVSTASPQLSGGRNGTTSNSGQRPRDHGYGVNAIKHHQTRKNRLRFTRNLKIHRGSVQIWSIEDSIKWSKYHGVIWILGHETRKNEVKLFLSMRPSCCSSKLPDFVDTACLMWLRVCMHCLQLSNKG